MAQQPQNGYRFPENIGFRSRPHRLLYDPGNPNTVMPDLSGAQIVSLSCEPVTASSQRLYMTYIELQIPARAAGGRVFAAKHIVGLPGVYAAGSRTVGVDPAGACPEGMPADCGAYSAAGDGHVYPRRRSAGRKPGAGAAGRDHGRERGAGPPSQHAVGAAGFRRSGAAAS